MRNIDFSPLYRSAIGYDRMATLLDAVNSEKQASFPPYNVERLEDDHYRITMAVAGFAEAELEITSEQNSLTISGRQSDDSEQRDFLYQGIAARNFERKFQLADHIRVKTARLSNGLLHVELLREVPEALRPRRVEISSDRNGELLEQNAA